MSVEFFIHSLIHEDLDKANEVFINTLNEKAKQRFSFETGATPIAPPKPVQKPERLKDKSQEKKPSQDKPKLTLRDVLRKPEGGQKPKLKKNTYYTPIEKTQKEVPPHKSSAEWAAMKKYDRNKMRSNILDFTSLAGGAYAAVKKMPGVGAAANLISSDPAY